MNDKNVNLSISIISFNEEENLTRLLPILVNFADQIVIVDCGSTDKTNQLAETYNCQLHIEEWKGHIEQKNSALAKCTGNWILSLDCDEVPNQELIENIVKVVQSNDSTFSYKINRKTYYLGKLLNYAWQPDIKLRLVHKSHLAQWQGTNPHDKLTSKADSKLLQGYLTHYSYIDLNDHLKRSLNYANISANAYYKKGRKFRLSNLIFNPTIAFIKQYVIKRGFLDGIRGLFAAISTFIHNFIKFAYLWEIERNNAKNKSK